MPVERHFDAASHTYSVGGEVWPSVTQALAVLNEYGSVRADLLEAARLFGRHVHRAVDLFNRGALDEAQLDPALAPYLEGWKLFLHESGAKISESEQTVWHDRLRYAGTLDCKALLRKRWALIDVKSGACPRSVGAQTAAYAAAAAFYGGPRIERRYCVTLQPGAYKLLALTGSGDFSLFVSCLNIWRFRHGTELRTKPTSDRGDDRSRRARSAAADDRDRDAPAIP